MLTQPQTTKKRIPTHEVAVLFPAQGEWTETEYLDLAVDTNRVVELNNGQLEVHDMPTDFHQLILVRLISVLYPLVIAQQLGHVRIAPLPVRLWPGKFREPDLVFMAAAHTERISKQFWGVPDLVAEVVLEGNVKLDRSVKIKEYARAGIPEYWIVDPETKTVEIYQLQGEVYIMRHNLKQGDTLTSSQLPDFQLALTDLFAEE